MIFKFPNLLFLMAGLMTVLPLQTADAAQRVMANSNIKVEYTLDINGKPVVSQSNPKTAEFRLGQGTFPSELEQPLIGLEVGDRTSVVLNPDEAYGQRRPELIKEIATELLPKSVRDAEPGQSFNLKGENGRIFYVRVVDAKENTIVLDQNHPLAGKYLTYYITVKSIR